MARDGSTLCRRWSAAFARSIWQALHLTKETAWTPDEIKLAKRVSKLLLELFPLTAVSKSVVSFSLDLFLDNAEGKPSKKSIERIGQEVAANLLAISASVPDHQGSAISAAADVISILEQSSLSPEYLIELNLDAELLEAHFLSIANEVFKNAGPRRIGYITDALNQVATKIVSCAPELPGVNVAFMRAMLKSRASQLPKLQA